MKASIITPKSTFFIFCVIFCLALVGYFCGLNQYRFWWYFLNGCWVASLVYLLISIQHYKPKSDRASLPWIIAQSVLTVVMMVVPCLLD